MKAQVDAFIGCLKEDGWSVASKRFPVPPWHDSRPIDAEKGVATYAEAFGRTEAEVRQAYASLTCIVKANNTPLKMYPLLGPMLPDAKIRLLLTSLHAAGPELWALYEHTATQLKKNGLCEFRHAYTSEILRVLEHALGLNSFTVLTDYFNGRVFNDDESALVPDRNDGMLDLSFSVPDTSVDSFVAQITRPGHEVLVYPKHRGDAGVDVGLRVPRDTNRALLLAAIEGCQVATSIDVAAWLKERS